MRCYVRWNLLAAVGPLLAALSATTLDAQRAAAQESYWEDLRGRAVGDVVESVDAASRDRAGRVYLADAAGHTIVVLDAKLRPIGRLGRQGAGPGEYRYLRAVKQIDSLRFATIDRALRRLYIYRWVKDTPVLERSVTIPFAPVDFCVLPGPRFVYYGNHASLRIHEVDTAGRIVASAAPYPAPTSRLIGDALAQGNLACSSAHSTLILTSSLIKSFELFTGSDIGSLRLSRLDSLHPARNVIITTKPGRISFQAPDDGYHSASRAVLMPDGFVIAAQVLRGRLDIEDSDTLDVFRFGFSRQGVGETGIVVGAIHDLDATYFLHTTYDENLELALKLVPKSALRYFDRK